MLLGLPRWLSSKASTCNAGAAGDMGSTPGSGRSPGRGHGNPLQYCCLENPMDRGAWQATVHRVAKSQAWLKQLSTNACYLLLLILYNLAQRHLCKTFSNFSMHISACRLQKYFVHTVKITIKIFTYHLFICKFRTWVPQGQGLCSMFHKDKDYLGI